MSDYTGPLKKPGPPGQHKAMYDALEGKSVDNPLGELHDALEMSSPPKLISSNHLTTALATAIAGLAEQLKSHYDGGDPKVIVTESLMHADNLQGFLEEYKQQQESKLIPGITLK